MWKKMHTGALMVLGLLPAAAWADVYPDSAGDQAGGAEVDISSVEVTNDATTLFVKINLTGSITSPTDFGNYHIGFDTAPGGKTTTGVAWGNPFGISSGMDYWIGSWVNFGGGAELHQYTGDGTSNVWSATIPGTTVTLGTNFTQLNVPLASLGLGPASSFKFDAWSTFGQPGGQSAYDASSNPANAVAQPWTGTPYDAGANVSTYTVPEPASLAAASLGLGLLLRRRSRE
jgi:hypothetical protein